MEQHASTILDPRDGIDWGSISQEGQNHRLKVYLENLKYRTRRESDIDPWSKRDMFRLNHQPLRELVLVKGDEDERSLWV